MAVAAIFGALCGFTSPTFGAEDLMRAPPKNSMRGDVTSRVSGSGRILAQAMRLFQRTISRVDGDRCSMMPTCSQYAVEAFSRHGAIKGMLMMVDRLFHEWSEPKIATKVVVHGVIRYWDPLEKNDFWFSQRAPLSLDMVEDVR